MAKELDKIIQVNGEKYEVTAVKADKVTNKLTIKASKEEIFEFDGSKSVTIDVAAGGDAASAEKAKEAEKAKKIEVHLDGGQIEDAIIRISKNDPADTDGELGDIWFKYI